jgi:hypothetical protein
VTVSYFEQVQNSYNFYWPLEEVQARLDAKMTKAFHAVHEMAQTQKVHNRLAAYLVAVKRVAEAVAMRGWVRYAPVYRWQLAGGIPRRVVSCNPDGDRRQSRDQPGQLPGPGRSFDSGR